MLDLSSIGENSLVPTMGTLNRCRFRHNHDRGTTVSRKVWKMAKSGKLVGGNQERDHYIYSIRDIYYTVIAVRRLWSHTSRGIEPRPFIVSITIDGL